MNRRLLAALVLLIFFGTRADSQDATVPPLPAESSRIGSTKPAPPIIIVESTTAMEESEVIQRVVEAMEKEGLARKAPRDESRDRAVDFHALISAKPDVSFDVIQQLVKTLKDLGLQRITFQVANADATNNIVARLPNGSWNKVCELHEALKGQDVFKVYIRVASYNEPMSPTLAVPDEQPPEPTTESSTPVDSARPIADRAQLAQERNESVRGLRDSSLQSVDDDPEPITVFHLRFSPARNTARIIEQLTVRAAKRPSLVVDERTNAIFVRGHEAAVREVTDLLKLLDAPEARNLDIPPTMPLAPATNNLEAVSVAELQQRCVALEQQSRDLARKLKGPLLKSPLNDPAEGNRLNDSLRKTVHEAFATRQELQRAELAEFTKRLQGLQQSLEMRQRIADKIIDRRIEELLDPNLNWDATSTAQGAVREFQAGDTPLWNEFGVTPKPVTPLTAKVLEWIGLHLNPITKERFREKNVLTKYEGGLDVTFVRTGGPAEKAGLQEEDIVVGLQGRPLLTLAELNGAMQMAVAQIERKDANALWFEVLRDGETVKVIVLFPAGIVDPFTNDALPHLTPPTKVNAKAAEDSLPFEFRLAQFEPIDGFEEFTVPGSEHKIYISREPLAMIFDVAAARVIDDANGRPSIEISYSSVAAKQMTEMTEQHLNKPLAIFVDGKLLSAPTIRQSFGSPALITGQFTREVAERIANGINRKLESLNTTIETLNSVSDGDPTPAGDVSTSDTTKELSGETPQ